MLETDRTQAAMHVGVQAIGTSKLELQFLARHGVKHMDGRVEDTETETLLRHREAAAAEGVSLDMIHIGLPRSITLAQDPERDRGIADVCQAIENAGKAGLRGINYNFYVGTFARTARTPGRGGSTYSTFRLEEYDNEVVGEAGRVSREEVFERAGYFLERVIPVAEANRVQFACHLNDPPAPVLQGVERWNYPLFEGLKRFSELVESPYHGFNFCCGTASEGLEDPGSELYDIVRYFGERRKIFNIHFRNIRGGLHDFQEVWPDEGDVDMYRLAQTLGDVGYPYMIMPDHVPVHPDDRPAEGAPRRVTQGWSFAFGYIIAMIQAVNAERG